jgi:hypothetical protein
MHCLQHLPPPHTSYDSKASAAPAPGLYMQLHHRVAAQLAAALAPRMAGHTPGGRSVLYRLNYCRTAGRLLLCCTGPCLLLGIPVATRAVLRSGHPICGVSAHTRAVCCAHSPHACEHVYEL